ncbi:hypothetical protein Y032_1020g3411 [Ancylostoma ceylanicum]|uniref:Uncharacterized protein n=1 Tax=Ancylostoma ceylanicum TaxID=53326 RepID=A0A016W6Z5_9BILA|nr:hypothetical protein Y032_1020g3411 [Ancylostoma ceylanicum]
MHVALLTVVLIPVTLAQINLGQFSLLPSPGGGWNMGLSQGANIFGFGGHRAFGISGNNAGIGLSGTDNVIVGNERIGVDSGLGVGQGRGIDLGSMLQFGNNPRPMHPGGQLGNFLDNVKNFFDSLIPHPAPPPMPMPTPMRRPRPRRPHRRRPWERPAEEVWESESEEVAERPPQELVDRRPQELVPSPRPHRVGTEGGVGPDGFLPRPWENQENIAPVDGDSNLSRRVSAEAQFPTLVPTTAEPWRNTGTTDEPDPFSVPKGRPRQLPGLVEMSHPS